MSEEALTKKDELDKKDKLDWDHFCDRIEAGNSFTKSLEMVERDKWWFGRMLKHPRLKKKYEDAKSVREEMRKEMREDALFTRAVEGVPRLVASGGKLVGEDRIYSDKLLEIAYMKDHPELMQDKGGGNTNIDFFLQQIENATPIGQRARAELVREQLAGNGVAALPAAAEEA